MTELEFRVRDLDTGEIIGYEFFNTHFSGGYYHLDLREMKEGETIDHLICHTYIIKPDRMNTIVREPFISKDSKGNKVYLGDVLVNELSGFEYKVTYDYSDTSSFFERLNGPEDERFRAMFIDWQCHTLKEHYVT